MSHRAFTDLFEVPRTPPVASESAVMCWKLLEVAQPRRQHSAKPLSRQLVGEDVPLAHVAYAPGSIVRVRGSLRPRRENERAVTPRYSRRPTQNTTDRLGTAARHRRGASTPKTRTAPEGNRSNRDYTKRGTRPTCACPSCRRGRSRPCACGSRSSAGSRAC